MADQTQTPVDAQAEWDAVAAEASAADSGEKTKVVEAAPAPAAAAPATAIEPEVVVDPYEGLSPDVRAKLERFDQMALTQGQLLNELKETKGRVSALQSEFAKTRQAQPAGDSPDQKQIAAAAKDPEKWSTLKRDFPEWGEGIEAFVDARVGALAGSGLTAEQVEQQVAQRVAAVSTEMAGELQKSLVENKYENWEEIVKTPKFTSWFTAQKPETQALAQSPKGRDALKMLDLFHAELATPVADVRQTRQQKLAAAVTGKPGAPVATKTFEDLTPKEQWNYMAEERARAAAA